MTKDDPAAASDQLFEIRRLLRDEPEAFLKIGFSLKTMVDSGGHVALGYSDCGGGSALFLADEMGTASSRKGFYLISIATAFEDRPDHARIERLGWTKAAQVARLHPSFHDEAIEEAELTPVRTFKEWVDARIRKRSVKPSVRSAPSATETSDGARTWIREQLSGRINEILDQLHAAGPPDEILEEFDQMRDAAKAVGLSLSSILASKGTPIERRAMKEHLETDLWS